MAFSLKSSEKIGLYRLKDVSKLCLKQLLPTQCHDSGGSRSMPGRWQQGASYGAQSMPSSGGAIKASSNTVSLLGHVTLGNGSFKFSTYRKRERSNLLEKNAIFHN